MKIGNNSMINWLSLETRPSTPERAEEMFEQNKASTYETLFDEKKMVESFIQNLTDELKIDNDYRGVGRVITEITKQYKTQPYVGERLRPFFQELTNDLQIDNNYRK